MVKSRTAEMYTPGTSIQGCILLKYSWNLHPWSFYPCRCHISPLEERRMLAWVRMRGFLSPSALPRLKFVSTARATCTLYIDCSSKELCESKKLPWGSNILPSILPSEFWFTLWAWTMYCQSNVSGLPSSLFPNSSLSDYKCMTDRLWVWHTVTKIFLCSTCNTDISLIASCN